MSTIRKKPFLKGMLEAMSDADIATLKSLLDNSSTVNTYADYNTVPEDAVACVDFHYEPTKSYHAILINEQSQKVLLVYFPFDKGLFDKTRPAQIVEFYNVDFTNKTCTQVQEYCDINELRSELDDEISGAYTDDQARAACRVAIDEENEEAIIINDLVEIDKENELVTVGDNLYVEGDVKLNSLQDIVDTQTGEPLIPDPTGHVGKVFKHITTGYEWGDYTPADVELKNTSGTIVGGIKFVKCTQAEYDALATKDSNTLYIING